MVKTLAKSWWVVAVRGMLGIAFGIAAFVWPGMTLFLLVALCCAYMMIDGAITVWQANHFRLDRERWMPLPLGVGLLTLFALGVVAVAWLHVLAAFLIVTGILETIQAIRLRKVIEGELFVILTAILSLGLSVVLFMLPLAGLIAWVWLFGAYSTVFGVLLLGLAFHLRKLLPTAPRSVSQAGGI